MTNQSVTQEWMDCCSFKQQTVLLSAIRSCDGVKKEDPCKDFTRALRREVLKNASPDDDLFMKWDLRRIPSGKMAEFCGDLDAYPNHWVMHFMHAAEIVGYYHPIEETRKAWQELYYQMVDALHLFPETKEQCGERLKDGRNSPVKRRGLFGVFRWLSSPSVQTEDTENDPWLKNVKRGDEPVRTTRSPSPYLSGGGPCGNGGYYD